MNREIKVDIGIDTGDGFGEYTANTVPPAYDSVNTLEETKDYASMVWLVKQQGHKLGELHYALDHIVKEPHLVENPFIRSVAYEVWHEADIYNQLVFLVKMTIGDLIKLNSLIRWSHENKKWGGYIVINPETTTGFFSTYVGGASLLKIKPEREVKIPIKHIAEAIPDDYYTYYNSKFCYSVYEVENNPELWDNGEIVYWSLPKHFRLSMEEMGLKPVKKNKRKSVDT